MGCVLCSFYVINEPPIHSFLLTKQLIGASFLIRSKELLKKFTCTTEIKCNEKNASLLMVNLVHLKETYKNRYVNTLFMVVKYNIHK